MNVQQPCNDSNAWLCCWSDRMEEFDLVLRNSNLYDAGSIHPRHRQFSDISLGRQCAFMSFSALWCAQSLLIEYWTFSTVDLIFAEGDWLYLDALEIISTVVLLNRTYFRFTVTSIFILHTKTNVCICNAMLPNFGKGNLGNDVHCY